MPRNPKLFKTVSALLIAAFFSQDLALAASDIKEAGHFFSSDSSAAARRAKKILPALDPAIATIEDAWFSDARPSEARNRDLKNEISRHFAPRNDKLVILIQDAHANPSGQLNLAETLDSILSLREKRSNLDLKNETASAQKKAPRSDAMKIFIEGSFGDNSLSEYRRFGTAAQRRRIANKYLQKGELNGEEYFDLTSEHDFKIIGVENRALYRRSLKKYKAVVRQRERFKKYLGELKLTLETLKTHLTSPSLALFLEANQRYKTKKTPFSDYLHVLKAHAQAAGVPLASFRNIRLALSIRNPRQFKKLNSEEVLREAVALEKLVLERLFDTPEDRAYYDALEYHRYLSRLVELSITPEEYGEYEALKNRRSLNRALGFLNAEISKLGRYYERALFIEPGFQGAVKNAEDFYDLTLARDQKFLENMETAEMVPGVISILIAGGYHAPNLKSLLRSKGISFISLRPAVTQETNQNKYEKILLKLDLIRFAPPVPVSANAMRTPDLKSWPSSQVPRVLFEIAALPETSRHSSGKGGGFSEEAAGARMASLDKKTREAMDELLALIGQHAAKSASFFRLNAGQYQAYLTILKMTKAICLEILADANPSYRNYISRMDSKPAIYEILPQLNRRVPPAHPVNDYLNAVKNFMLAFIQNGSAPQSLKSSLGAVASSARELRDGIQDDGRFVDPDLIVLAGEDAKLLPYRNARESLENIQSVIADLESKSDETSKTDTEESYAAQLLEFRKTLRAYLDGEMELSKFSTAAFKIRNRMQSLYDRVLHENYVLFSNEARRLELACLVVRLEGLCIYLGDAKRAQNRSTNGARLVERLVEGGKVVMGKHAHLKVSAEMAAGGRIKVFYVRAQDGTVLRIHEDGREPRGVVRAVLMNGSNVLAGFDRLESIRFEYDGNFSRYVLTDSAKRKIYLNAFGIEKIETFQGGGDLRKPLETHHFQPVAGFSAIKRVVGVHGKTVKVFDYDEEGTVRKVSGVNIVGGIDNSLEKIAAEILEIHRRNRAKNKPTLVNIIGEEASGKGTLARLLSGALKSEMPVLVIPVDSWMLDRNSGRRPTDIYLDKLELLGAGGYYQSVERLAQGREIFIPIFDSNLRKRESVSPDLLSELRRLRPMRRQGRDIWRIPSGSANAVAADLAEAHRRNFIPSRLYVDSATGDLLERVLPARGLVIVEGVLTRHDPVAARNFSKSIYVESSQSSRLLHAYYRYLKEGRHADFTPEKIVSEFIERSDQEGRAYIKSSIGSVDWVVDNRFTFSDEYRRFACNLPFETKNPALLEAAVRVLGEMDRPESIEALTKILKSNADVTVKNLTVRMLNARAKPRLKQELEEVYHHMSPIPGIVPTMVIDGSLSEYVVITKSATASVRVRYAQDERHINQVELRAREGQGQLSAKKLVNVIDAGSVLGFTFSPAEKTGRMKVTLIIRDEPFGAVEALAGGVRGSYSILDWEMIPLSEALKRDLRFAESLNLHPRQLILERQKMDEVVWDEAVRKSWFADATARIADDFVEPEMGHLMEALSDYFWVLDRLLGFTGRETMALELAELGASYVVDVGGIGSFINENRQKLASMSFNQLSAVWAYLIVHQLENFFRIRPFIDESTGGGRHWDPQFSLGTSFYEELHLASIMIANFMQLQRDERNSRTAEMIEKIRHAGKRVYDVVTLNQVLDISRSNTRPSGARLISRNVLLAAFFLSAIGLSVVQMANPTPVYSITLTSAVLIPFLAGVSVLLGLERSHEKVMKSQGWLLAVAVGSAALFGLTRLLAKPILSPDMGGVPVWTYSFTMWSMALFKLFYIDEKLLGVGQSNGKDNLLLRQDLSLLFQMRGRVLSGEASLTPSEKAQIQSGRSNFAQRAFWRLSPFWLSVLGALSSQSLRSTTLYLALALGLQPSIEAIIAPIGIVIFPSLMAYSLLGETFTRLKLFGCALILTGFICLPLVRTSWEGVVFSPLTGGLALASGLFYGLRQIFHKEVFVKDDALKFLSKPERAHLSMALNRLGYLLGALGVGAIALYQGVPLWVWSPSFFILTVSAMFVWTTMWNLVALLQQNKNFSSSRLTVATATFPFWAILWEAILFQKIDPMVAALGTLNLVGGMIASFKPETPKGARLSALRVDWMAEPAKAVESLSLAIKDQKDLEALLPDLPTSAEVWVQHNSPTKLKLFLIDTSNKVLLDLSLSKKGDGAVYLDHGFFGSDELLVYLMATDPSHKPGEFEKATARVRKMQVDWFEQKLGAWLTHREFERLVIPDIISKEARDFFTQELGFELFWSDSNKLSLRKKLSYEAQLSEGARLAGGPTDDFSWIFGSKNKEVEPAKEAAEPEGLDEMASRFFSDSLPADWQRWLSVRVQVERLTAPERVMLDYDLGSAIKRQKIGNLKDLIEKVERGIGFAQVDKPKPAPATVTAEFAEEPKVVQQARRRAAAEKIFSDIRKSVFAFHRLVDDKESFLCRLENNPSYRSGILKDQSAVVSEYGKISTAIRELDQQLEGLEKDTDIFREFLGRKPSVVEAVERCHARLRNFQDLVRFKDNEMRLSPAERRDWSKYNALARQLAGMSEEELAVYLTDLIAPKTDPKQAPLRKLAGSFSALSTPRTLLSAFLERSRWVEGGQVAGFISSGRPASETFDPRFLSTDPRYLIFLRELEYRYRTLFFSPDGKIAVVRYFPGAAKQGGAPRIKIVDAATGEDFEKKIGDETQVKRVSFSPDGKLLWINSTPVKAQEAQAPKPLVRDMKSILYAKPSPQAPTPAPIPVAKKTFEGEYEIERLLGASPADAGEAVIRFSSDKTFVALSAWFGDSAEPFKRNIRIIHRETGRDVSAKIAGEGRIVSVLFDDEKIRTVFSMKRPAGSIENIEVDLAALNESIKKEAGARLATHTVAPEDLAAQLQMMLELARRNNMYFYKRPSGTQPAERDFITVCFEGSPVWRVDVRLNHDLPDRMGQALVRRLATMRSKPSANAYLVSDIQTVLKNENKIIIRDSDFSALERSSEDRKRSALLFALDASAWDRKYLSGQRWISFRTAPLIANFGLAKSESMLGVFQKPSLEAFVEQIRAYMGRYADFDEPTLRKLLKDPEVIERLEYFIRIFQDYLKVQRPVEYYQKLVEQYAVDGFIPVSEKVKTLEAALRIAQGKALPADDEQAKPLMKLFSSTEIADLQAALLTPDEKGYPLAIYKIVLLIQDLKKVQKRQSGVSGARLIEADRGLVFARNVRLATGRVGYLPYEDRLIRILKYSKMHRQELFENPTDQQSFSFNDFQQALNRARFESEQETPSSFGSDVLRVAELDLDSLESADNAVLTAPLLLEELKRRSRLPSARGTLLLLTGKGELKRLVAMSVQSGEETLKRWVLFDTQDELPGDAAFRQVVVRAGKDSKLSDAGKRRFYLSSFQRGNVYDWRGILDDAFFQAGISDEALRDPSSSDAQQFFSRYERRLRRTMSSEEKTRLVQMCFGQAFDPLLQVPPLSVLPVNAILRGARLALGIIRASA